MHHAFFNCPILASSHGLLTKKPKNIFLGHIHDMHVKAAKWEGSIHLSSPSPRFLGHCMSISDIYTARKLSQTIRDISVQRKKNAVFAVSRLGHRVDRGRRREKMRALPRGMVSADILLWILSMITTFQWLNDIGILLSCKALKTRLKWQDHGEWGRNPLESYQSINILGTNASLALALFMHWSKHKKASNKHSQFLLVEIPQPKHDTFNILE